MKDDQCAVKFTLYPGLLLMRGTGIISITWGIQGFLPPRCQRPVKSKNAGGLYRLTHSYSSPHRGAVERAHQRPGL